MSAEENLKKLNIDLPKAPDPVGSYVASKIAGNLVFISGQVPFDSGGKLIKGKVGKELSLERAQEAAKFCALNLLAQLKKICGNLDKVKGCVKITGYVNSVDSFIDQPKVINGASDLISKVFGDKGKHARAAVSANSLPLGASVEVEGIFEI
jgi:enamine deaminase RidA (YjgF/YER057c/UK114 family)